MSTDDRKNKSIPETWSEIPEDKRQAILEMAEGNIFWKNVSKRFGNVGKAAQICLALVALWVVFKESAATWIQSMGHNK